jgi:hypothetical protein
LWAGAGKDSNLDFAVALGSDLFDALQAAIKIARMDSAGPHRWQNQQQK